MESRENNRLAVLLDGVHLSVGGSRILEDIDWSIRRGERWVLLGANGSGKTSLLRMISGYAFPSAGRVEVLGERFGHTDLRELRRKVSWVNGDLKTLIPDFMTARDVVLSGPRGALVIYENDDGPESARAVEHLDALHAGPLASRKFSTLSTGERQRVLIARAMMGDPDILLLDEPCLGLDPLSREEFLISLTSLFRLRPDLTIITVTHHVEEVIGEYHGALVLEGGRVAARGPVRRVLTTRVLSGIFGPRCRITRGRGRFGLRFR